MGLGSGRESALDEELLALGKRIERWRQGKAKRNSRMPEELWRAAAALSKTRGIRPIVKAFGLNRFALKRRLEEGSQATGIAVPSSGFLELLPQPPRPECCLEVFAEDGARLKISMPASQSVDWSGIVDRFLGRRR